MKIKQLIELLRKYDNNTRIVLSSDAEGNDFRFLDDVSYEGELWDFELVDDEKVIILWPI